MLHCGMATPSTKRRRDGGTKMNEALELLKVARELVAVGFTDEAPISSDRSLKKVEITHGRTTEVAWKDRRGKYYVLHPSKRYWTTLKKRPGEKFEEKPMREKNKFDKFPLRASVVVASEDNSLDGMNKQRAKRNVNSILQKMTPNGIVRDNDWRNVTVLFKALTEAAIDWDLTKTFYDKDREGRPNSKTWKFEVNFTNNRGRNTTLYGVVVASGAGSVEDPLDAYDIVAYVS